MPPPDPGRFKGMCEACNLAKQAPDWHTTPAPGPHGTHGIATTLPTGHHYLTRPPPLTDPKGPGPRQQPSLRVDFVLTG
ncbi:hypothetical protein K8W59_00700 [Nocardioides rotundus]|uniref:hypothetical protein n=1 Tax=Nocardioides rotundus TaxID=1774216 RepID=UPI001CBE5622|nr:hypothetical protein [Nocardioides rotundus]UAL30109.1 hypothetical protein K8W59_00700 [Nocardioides rotundus]